MKINRARKHGLLLMSPAVLFGLYILMRQPNALEIVMGGLIVLTLAAGLIGLILGAMILFMGETPWDSRDDY